MQSLLLGLYVKNLQVVRDPISAHCVSVRPLFRSQKKPPKTLSLKAFIWHKSTARPLTITEGTSHHTAAVRPVKTVSTIRKMKDLNNTALIAAQQAFVKVSSHCAVCRTCLKHYQTLTVSSSESGDRVLEANSSRRKS